MYVPEYSYALQFSLILKGVSSPPWNVSVGPIASAFRCRYRPCREPRVHASRRSAALSEEQREMMNASARPWSTTCSCRRGAAGLSAQSDSSSSRLRERDISCVSEKGSEVGAHPLGERVRAACARRAVPDWRDADRMADTAQHAREGRQVPEPTGRACHPRARICSTTLDAQRRQLHLVPVSGDALAGAHAEGLGGDLPGFSARSCHHDSGAVKGRCYRDVGINKDGTPKTRSCVAWAHGKQVLFGEGCRGPARGRDEGTTRR